MDLCSFIIAKVADENFDWLGMPLTEQSFFNQRASDVSIIEKQAKMVRPVYQSVVKVTRLITGNAVADEPEETDMRHILGFLNQTEWVGNLNIGNIMQIQPIEYEELVQWRRNEQELERTSFLELISFLVVGYFCLSTELRFIIQLKEEIP